MTSRTPEAPRHAQRRVGTVTAATALAAILVTIVVVGSVFGTVLGLTTPIRYVNVPSFLEPGNPVVEGARRGASGTRELISRIRDEIRAGFPQLGDLWSAGPPYATGATVELWRRDHAIRLRAFPAYVVPADPTWAEDPFGDARWVFDFQTLSWLTAARQASDDTGDGRYLDQARVYVLDWIRNARVNPPPSPMTWSAEAVPVRTSVVVGLLVGGLWDTFGDDELGRLLNVLEEHGQLLAGYLADPAVFASPEGLVHARALDSLVLALPVLRNATAWRETARARIDAE